MEVGTEFYLDLSKAAEISVEIPETAESVVEKPETSDSAVVDKSETSESDAVDKTETAESEVDKLEIFKNGEHPTGTVASTVYSQGEEVEAIVTDNFDHHLDINNALEASFVDNVDIMIQKNLHTLHPNVSESLFPSNNISSTLPTHENVSFPRTTSTGTVLSGSGDSELPTTINTGDYSPSTIEPFGEMLPKTQYKERKRKRLKSFKSNSDSSQINSGEPSSLYVQALPLRQNDVDRLHNDRANPVIESLVPRNGELSTVTSPFDGDSQEESYHPMVAHSRSRTNIYPDNSPPEAAGFPLNPPPESKHFSSTLRPSLARTTRTYGLSPGSLKPYSNRQSNIDKSVRSVCHEDPCGAGVACHPVGTSFECVCSDDTKVEPNQPCPDIGTVDYTPPAKSMPQGNEALTKPSQTLILVLVITLSLMFILLTLFYWKRKKFGKFLRQTKALKSSKDSNESISKLSTLHTYNFASNPNYYTSHHDELPLQALSVQLISKDEINFLGDLGEGCFGRVYKGECFTKDLFNDSESEFGSVCSLVDDVESGGSVDSLKKLRDPKKKIVAVKVLKELVGVEGEADFMREVEIMSSFRHPNILSLIGVVVADTGGTPWMVFEFMPYGDLAEVLRSCNKQFSKNYMPMNSLSKIELLNICSQVAAGMEYLSLQHFVHRDLACRNCLVGQNLTVKISDFGMSRDVYTCDYYKVGGSRMLPVRWMAPESILYGKFTLESDVWSFGVVLWEVYSFGKQPYYGSSNEEVVQLILQGILLGPSDKCPPLVREVMRLCWSTEPHNRLRFPEIVERLNEAKKLLLEFQDENSDGDSFRKVNYSQLSMQEDTPELPTLDPDQYLLPKCKNGPTDEYLTVLQG